MRFRAYRAGDRAVCLRLFDLNCPAFFAPNERAEYEHFLDLEATHYEVAEDNGALVAAYGLAPSGDDAWAVRWIMVDPGRQGAGIGGAAMRHLIETARARQAASIVIAASHLSAPFFARFAASAYETIADGWGPGMHRVNMRIALASAPPR